MIEFIDVNYRVAEYAILTGINLKIQKGECVLLVGESGSGKTTLTKLINGLIPHFYSNGQLGGGVFVQGVLVAETEMYKLSEKIGSVFQNPKSQFFYTDSSAEIAFGLENRGVSPEKIRQRIQATANELGIEKLLGRNIFKLSGGEKQIIAFASAYAAEPEIYVLDEPSSNLDNISVERLKKLLHYIKSKGKTVIIAEHRLNYLRSAIDRVIYLKAGQVMREFTARQFSTLSERERISMGLRTLKETRITIPECTAVKGELCIGRIFSPYTKQEICFGASSGDVIGIVGNNGVGKTTLCKMICGLLKEQSGTVSYQGKKLTRRQRQRLCAMVMQDVNHQLFTDSVVDECELAAPDASKEKIDKILQGFDLLSYKEVHPAVLSGGQRQRLAVCQAVLSGKKVVIFDEPTSGLDYTHMMQTGEIIKKLSHEGYIVLVITHDYEFLNLVCHSVIQLYGQGAVKGRARSEEEIEEKEKKLV